jgi:hypothetical protein
MKKLLLKPRISKAERVYLQHVTKRPFENTFREIARKVQDYLNKPNPQGE